MKLTGIERSLREGCRVHAFRSGGGLRVVRIERDGELKGYGEHPQVEDALSHADEDFLAGGRKYGDVYGVTKPHYWTGSSTPTSQLDQWLLSGHTFDVWREGDDVVFQLKGWVDVITPEEIIEKVKRTGKSEVWENRGYTYRIYRDTLGGQLCTVREVISGPREPKGDVRSSMYEATKTGRGRYFWDALDSAFDADEVEIDSV